MTSIAVCLRIVMERSPSICLEVHQSIILWRRRNMWQIVLMMLPIWSRRQPRPRFPCTFCSCSDAWRALSWMRHSIPFLDNLQLSHWTQGWVNVRMIHCMRRLNNSMNLLPCNRPALNSCRIYGVLVVKIHVGLSALRGFDSLAGSKDLVKQSILLLTAIWIAPLNLKLLLRARSGSSLLFLVITNIC